ncbi:hypothetical protein GDO78_019075 [Eleutherodactylus coqui]|uniref:Uncharacterized protein n=1 Tax=Eleutherodactylus coqui TaxID=57060 RepID=A0A8J6EPF2_ELECQ|nr:hypothetical protein GDO78_019075 [Eleutherodactylus coqui]
MDYWNRLAWTRVIMLGAAEAVTRSGVEEVPAPPLAHTFIPILGTPCQYAANKRLKHSPMTYPFKKCAILVVRASQK